MFFIKSASNIMLGLTMIFSLTCSKNTINVFNENNLNNSTKICIEEDEEIKDDDNKVNENDNQNEEDNIQNNEENNTEKKQQRKRVKLRPEKEVKIELNNNKFKI